MSAENKSNTVIYSRRNLFRDALMVAGGAAAMGAALMATSATASGKIAQKLVGYQNMPKGVARCDNCLQWQPPAACKIVAGAISPAGWCTVYAPKPKS